MCFYKVTADSWWSVRSMWEIGSRKYYENAWTLGTQPGQRYLGFHWFYMGLDVVCTMTMWYFDMIIGLWWKRLFLGFHIGFFSGFVWYQGIISSWIMSRHCQCEHRDLLFSHIFVLGFFCKQLVEAENFFVSLNLSNTDTIFKMNITTKVVSPLKCGLNMENCNLKYGENFIHFAFCLTSI